MGSDNWIICRGWEIAQSVKSVENKNLIVNEDRSYTAGFESFWFVIYATTNFSVKEYQQKFFMAKYEEVLQAPLIEKWYVVLTRKFCL